MEEVITLNEEPRATNEELETLNEEVQATVEEPRTADAKREVRRTEAQELATEPEAERAQLAVILADIGDAVLRAEGGIYTPSCPWHADPPLALV